MGINGKGLKHTQTLCTCEDPHLKPQPTELTTQRLGDIFKRCKILECVPHVLGVISH